MTRFNAKIVLVDMLYTLPGFWCRTHLVMQYVCSCWGTDDPNASVAFVRADADRKLCVRHPKLL